MAKDLSEEDDESLMIRVMDHDQAAFEAVLDRRGPRVKGFLKSKFRGVLQDPELKKAFNVAAFNLWRFADRYDTARKGKLGSWFLRIANNAALSVIRGEERHRAKDLEYDPSYDPAECDASPDIDSKEHKALKEVHRFIHNELVGFEQIVAINDYIAGGKADTERLARLHGKTIGTVRTTRSKVNKKLLENLHEWQTLHASGRVKP